MFHAAKFEATEDTQECLFCQEGHKPGPSLAVVGRLADMEKVAARMENVPSLAYIRGSISIYGVDSQQNNALQPAADDVLYLLDAPEKYSVNGAPSATQYWLALQRAAELGIIAGRGVPVTIQKRKPFA